MKKYEYTHSDMPFLKKLTKKERIRLVLQKDHWMQLRRYCIRLRKEEYYYRTIFEEHFPSESAARSVPSVPSVACSTAEALAWDASFQGKNDPSGRAVAGVHEEAYKD